MLRKKQNYNAGLRSHYNAFIKEKKGGLPFFHYEVIIVLICSYYSIYVRCYIIKV